MQDSAQLARHNVLSTSDYDHAREQVGAIFCPHKLTPGSNVVGGKVVFNHAPLQAVSVNWVDYGRDVRIEPVAFENFYLLQIVREGTARIASRGRTFEVRAGEASLINPDDDLAMDWSGDCRKLIVRIDATAMQRFAEQFFGSYLSRPLQFDNAVSWSGAPLGVARGLIDMIVDHIDTERGPFGYSDAQHHIESALFSSLLVAQDHSMSRWVGNRSPAVPRAVKRAEDYIVAHAGEDITVTDLVEASGVSTRTLFESFRRFKGVTPMQYLRRYRLDRAHEELSKPGCTASITEVAMRWNFDQLGRFASYYASVFGERPSDTLRRGRSLN